MFYPEQDAEVATTIRGVPVTFTVVNHEITECSVDLAELIGYPGVTDQDPRDKNSNKGDR